MGGRLAKNKQSTHFCSYSDFYPGDVSALQRIACLDYIVSPLPHPAPHPHLVLFFLNYTPELHYQPYFEHCYKKQLEEICYCS